MMIRWLYSLLWYLALPLVLVRLYQRSGKSPAYAKRIKERFGWVKKSTSNPLWIHAVSVGEVVAITPLIKRLLAEQPETKLLITSMTPTGSERIHSLFGEQVEHCYCPYDLPDAWTRFLRRLQPRALVIVETELWPNMIASCKAQKLPIILANARLSKRSAQGYAKISWLIKPLLKQLNLIAVQHKNDQQNFLHLDAKPEQISVIGSLKFELEIEDNINQIGQQLKQSWGLDRPVLILASSHEDEERQIIELYKNLVAEFSDLLLILVPRHPERFQNVFELAQTSGYKVERKSETPANPASQIYLVDSMGELIHFYAAADIAIVGGSLVPRGGHNPLEPAALSKAIIMGVHCFNFEAICSDLEQAKGLIKVDSAQALEQSCRQLLQQPSKRIEMGNNAQQFVAANKGALDYLYQQVVHICLKIKA